jgi:hypothetical protein
MSFCETFICSMTLERSVAFMLFVHTQLLSQIVVCGRKRRACRGYTGTHYTFNGTIIPLLLDVAAYFATTFA